MDGHSGGERRRILRGISRDIREDKEMQKEVESYRGEGAHWPMRAKQSVSLRADKATAHERRYVRWSPRRLAASGPTSSPPPCANHSPQDTDGSVLAEGKGRLEEPAGAGRDALPHGRPT